MTAPVPGFKHLDGLVRHDRRAAVSQFAAAQSLKHLDGLVAMIVSAQIR